MELLIIRHQTFVQRSAKSYPKPLLYIQERWDGLQIALSCIVFVLCCAHICIWAVQLALAAGCVEYVEVLILKAADTLALMEDTLDSSDAAARHSAITLTLIRTEKTTHSSTMHSAKYRDLKAAIITSRE